MIFISSNLAPAVDASFLAKNVTGHEIVSAHMMIPTNIPDKLNIKNDI